MGAATSGESRCPTCKRRYKRSLAVNSLYWRLLTLMSEREWHGTRYSPQAFHMYYKLKYLGADDVAMPNGKVQAVPRSTADLDAEEFAAYFDRVQADANERGVFLEDAE